MTHALAIFRKELNSYFGSPMALIFIGVFLATTLFTFFWADAFFARGISDVRPMFRWMPILLIFLTAALTMRQWSEEQQTGTLEMLLTLPAPIPQLVLGKFLAVLALVTVALGMTLFLPVSVAILGNLDWGPVVGGYLAALLLAAAYTALGLFLSSRTDNQIVALILTVLVGGLLYLVGSSTMTGFVGDSAAEWLRALGAGSRFESIERGVVDLRDLVYYLSLAGIFLALNVLSLESKRWSRGAQGRAYRQGLLLTTALVALNLLLLNVWLHPLNRVRLDLTSQREYSLSPTTRDLLGSLQEPLLVRGYFSERTHPLLAPLVPQIRDMLEEYRVASNGRVVVEIVDPVEEPEKEAEANQTYGIQPTPLQVTDRYGAAVVNAYFDVLIRYGDQSVVLTFQDLIEISPTADGQAEVSLRNLEYDLTRAVKKVVYGFQSLDAVLGQLSEPASLTLFVTPEMLPEGLAEAPATIEAVAQEIQGRANGKFTYEIVNPDAPDSPLSREALAQQYGLRPIPTDLFGTQSYYLHMLLQVGEEQQSLTPSGALTEADVRTLIESAMKRGTSGFLKVVGLWVPPDTPTQDPFGQSQPSLKQYSTIAQQLSQDYTVQRVDLASGQVPPGLDVLVVVAPQGMSDRERYAIDQYLMRGGAVVVAAGNFALTVDPFAGSLALEPITDGLRDMLLSYGVDVQQVLVLDAQNEPFPVEVARDVGGLTVREIQAINYPFFVDVRGDGMERESPLLANLPAVTMNWASPVVADEAKNAERTVTTLLRSSGQSWLRTTPDIQPNLDLYPEMGFPVEEPLVAQPLALSVQGSFESFFKDQNMPAAPGAVGSSAPLTNTVGTIEQSPDSARLVVIGSAEFLNDVVFNLSSTLSQERYLNSLQFMQNAVDWSVEDLDLLAIRSRGNATRLLEPLSERQQRLWELLNYAVALLALIAVAGVWRARQSNEQPMDLLPPSSPPADPSLSTPVVSED